MVCGFMGAGLPLMFSALERFSEWPGLRVPAAATADMGKRGDRPGGARQRRTRLRPYHLLLIVWSADMVLAALAGIASRIAALGPGRAWHMGDAIVVVVIALLTWAAFADQDMAHVGNFVSLRLQRSRMLGGWLNAFGILMLLLLAGEALHSALPGSLVLPTLAGHTGTALWMLWLFASGLAFLTVGRLALVRLLARLAPADLDRDGTASLRAVVIGEGLHGARIFADLRALPAPIRVLSLVDRTGAVTDATPDAALDQDELDFRVHARAATSLVELLRRGPIDTVVVALPRGTEHQVRDILDSLTFLPVDVWLAPDFGGETDPALHPLVGDMPLLHLRGRPLTTFQLAVKKLEDMVVASLLMLVAGPVMLLIALAIKLDSRGPVMFVQVRRGYNERLIGVLKFRTMRADMTDEHAERQTVRDDERVTRVGRFLRRFSLDELPQLINVLRGEMSVVGPRPHALQTKAAGVLFDEVVAKYGARHRVKPGITGWAQINGWRGETDTVEKIVKRVEFDIDYIENWSLHRDLAIICKTALRVLVDREAV
jgi:Undecaprenyl-phosphate glucose phosphotransferase